VNALIVTAPSPVCAGLVNRHSTDPTVEEGKSRTSFPGLGYRVCRGTGGGERPLQTSTALKHFPARSPGRKHADTFYLSESTCCARTTSPVQIRHLKSTPPAGRGSWLPARLFRRDAGVDFAPPRCSTRWRVGDDEGLDFQPSARHASHFLQQFSGILARCGFQGQLLPLHFEPSAEGGCASWRGVASEVMALRHGRPARARRDGLGSGTLERFRRRPLVSSASACPPRHRMTSGVCYSSESPLLEQF